MQRFFISDENMQGENVVLRGQQVHQIRDVLRMRPGDSIIVLDNRGWEYEGGRSKQNERPAENRLLRLHCTRVCSSRTSLSGYSKSVRRWE
jgi:16S rRNA (uracil1498-N3)-methyltransferase